MGGRISSYRHKQRGLVTPFFFTGSLFRKSSLSLKMFSKKKVWGGGIKLLYWCPKRKKNGALIKKTSKLSQTFVRKASM